MEASRPHLSLEAMPRLVNAKGPEEDWTGLKSAAERRKLQNRLNVRAHRLRKAKEQLAAQTGSNREAGTKSVVPSQQQPPVSPTSSTTNPQFIGPIQIPNLSQQSLATHSPCQSRELVKPWIEVPHAHPSLSFPYLYFPLPIDHRLICLVQYNVLRAVTTNMLILSLQGSLSPTHRMTSECVRMQNLIPLFPAPNAVPLSLKPTNLQRSLKSSYSPWINLLPSPRMRDNAILLAGTGNLDEDELCRDVMGYYKGPGGDYKNSDGRVENTGMVVWTDPWHPRGWELTEGFIEKWTALLKGCQDLVVATNSWRATRNEDPLIVEL